MIFICYNRIHSNRHRPPAVVMDFLFLWSSLYPYKLNIQLDLPLVHSTNMFTTNHSRYFHLVVTLKNLFLQIMPLLTLCSLIVFHHQLFNMVSLVFMMVCGMLNEGDQRGSENTLFVLYYHLIYGREMVISACIDLSLWQYNIDKNGLPIWSVIY